MEFVWNKIQAEDIREQSAAAMQGSTDYMKDQAAAFKQEAIDLQAEAAALQEAAADILATLPIYKTINVTGTKTLSDGSREEYSQTKTVVDEAATDAKQAQAEALMAEADEKNDRADELNQAAKALNAAANILNQKIATTNELFKKLFDMIMKADETYAAKMLDIKIQIAMYQTMMQGIRDSFTIMFNSVGMYASDLSPGSPDASGLNEVAPTDADIALSAAMIAIMQLAQENGNAQAGVDILNALTVLPGLQDRAGILNIIVGSPEIYRNMVFAVAHELYIGRIDVPGRFLRPGLVVDGVTIERATIEFNVTDDSNGAGGRGNFFVFFHEVGHLIDWYFRDTNGRYFLTGGDTFRDNLYTALTRDVESTLRDVAAGLPVPSLFPFIESSSPLSIASYNVIREKAIANIIGGNLVIYEHGLTVPQQFQLLLQDAMDVILGRNDETDRRHEMLNPSNIFGGITNNVVRGAWTHTEVNYWYHNNNKQSPTYMQNLEFFANYFAASMLNNQAMLDNMRDFFPGASEILSDITANITSRIGG